MNNPGLGIGTVQQFFKTFSSCAVKVLPDLVVETMVQVGQRYISREALLAVPRSTYVPDEILSSLKAYDKQRNVLQNIAMKETTLY